MGVVAIEPDDLLGLEHLDVDEPAVDRREGQGLEPEHLLLRTLDLARYDHHQILDPDPVFASFVIARLVGDDHAPLERFVAAALRTAYGRNALRPLVDGKEAADAVAGAVGIVETGFPQRPPSEAVKLAAARALGKHGRGDGDMAFEHAGEAVAHFGGRFADRHRAGDVGGAVDILAAGVD